MSGYVPDVFSESIHLYIGSCATGRARAGNTTLDTVVFAQLPGQPAPTTFTAADVGCPIAIIGGGPINPLMPAIWDVQGATFVTTIAAYVSPTQVTLAAAPDTAYFNTGFFNIVVYRRCLMQLDSFQLSKSIAPGTRDTFDFTVLAKNNPYIDRFTTIAMGQPIYLKSTDPAVGELYGGEVDTLTTSNLVGTVGTFSWSCHCAGYDGVAGRRAVNPVFPQVFTGPANDVFTKICLYFMNDEGIDVTSTITDQVTIACPVGAYINTLLDQVVQALSALGRECYWYSDPWRNYFLKERSSTAAPWDIDDGEDLLAGQQPIQLQLTETHDKLSTFTYAVATNILLDALNATILGDGTSTTFNLPQKVASTPTITLNGVAQTVGILGIDTGKDWYWNQGSTTLTQDAGGVILTAADTLVVAYQFTIAGVASAPNYTGAVERQKEEAGSGTYDHVIQVSQVVTPDELLAIAVSNSEQYGIPAKTAKISTLRPGITTGQLQHITLPDVGADGDFLVATMRLFSKDKVLQWDYTAFSGANVGNGITGLVQFINRGEGTLQLLQPVVPITSPGTPAAAAGQNVIGKTVFGVGVTFPNSVVQGNLLVLVAERNSVLGNPPTVTDSQGNTWIQARFAQTGGGFPNQISILYTFASASGPLTVICASAEWQAMMEFSGMDSASPVETSGDAVGTTPPTLTLADANDLVLTGLANVASVPTVSGSEVLLGYKQNTGQPGVAYSYALPGVGSFQSTLRDSGGSSSSVFISVAFRRKGGTAPPAQTVDVFVNPAGSVTQSGALTVDQPAFGDGGSAIKVGTKTGNTNKVVTASGTQTLDHPLLYDANGNAADGDPGQLVPPGGNTGYVLTKQSPTDYDADWAPGGSSGSGALVLLETHAASASSSLDFTAWRDDSLYEEYLIEFVGLVSDTPAIRFSINGGSTYDAGVNYAYNGAFAFNSAQGQYGSSGTTSFPFRNGSTTLSAAGSWSGSLKLFGPQLTTWPQLTGQVVWLDNSLGIVSVQLVGVYNNSAGATNAFQVLALSGNIASGTVRVYGITK